MRIYICIPEKTSDTLPVQKSLRTMLHDALAEYYGEFDPADIEFFVSTDRNIRVYIMEEAIHTDSSGGIINAVRNVLGHNSEIRLNYQKLNPDFKPENHYNVQTEKSSYRISGDTVLSKKSLKVNTGYYSPSCSVHLTMKMLLDLVKERLILNKVKEVLFVELRSIKDIFPEENVLFKGAMAEGYTHLVAAVGYNGEIVEGSIEWIMDQNNPADPEVSQLLRNGSILITR